MLPVPKELGGDQMVAVMKKEQQRWDLKGQVRTLHTEQWRREAQFCDLWKDPAEHVGTSAPRPAPAGWRFERQKGRSESSSCFVLFYAFGISAQWPVTLQEAGPAGGREADSAWPLISPLTSGSLSPTSGLKTS